MPTRLLQLALCLPFLAAFSASATDTLRTVQLQGNAMLLGSRGEVGILKDDLSDHDTFDIGEMMFAPATVFRPSESSQFRFGFSRLAHWLRIDLTDTVDRRLILELDNPYLSQVAFYEVSEGEVIDTLVGGSTLPFLGRKHWNLRDTIRLGAGDTVRCFIHLPFNRSLTDFHLFLSDGQYRALADQRETLALLIFFCLVFVYLLMLGIAIYLTRLRYFWYYFAYVLLVSGYIFADTGLGFMHLWPRWPYLQQASLPTFGNAYLIAGTIFVMAHFRTRRQYPLHHLCLRVAVVVAATMIPVALVLPSLPPFAAHLFNYVQGVAYILTVGLFFWLAATALSRHDRAFPGWLLVGFLIHGMSVIYSNLENFKLVPPISLQELLLERGHLIAFHTPVVLMMGLLVEMAIVLLIGMRRFKQLVAEQQRLAKELAQQRQQNLNALALGMETEQRRIAQELHDGLAGGIAAAKFKLESIEGANPNVPGLGTVVRELSEMHQELREIAHNLMPKHLHKQGLLPAVEQLIHRMETTDNRLKINLFCNADLTSANELARVYLYRISQELLANLFKHAQATEAWLQFVRDGDNLLLTLEDNGRGFDTKNGKPPSSGIGLANIRYRVEDALGGKFSVESEPGKGAMFTIEIPWKALESPRQ